MRPTSSLTRVVRLPFRTATVETFETFFIFYFFGIHPALCSVCTRPIPPDPTLFALVPPLPTQPFCTVSGRLGDERLEWSLSGAVDRDV